MKNLVQSINTTESVKPVKNSAQSVGQRKPKQQDEQGKDKEDFQTVLKKQVAGQVDTKKVNIEDTVDAKTVKGKSLDTADTVKGEQDLADPTDDVVKQSKAGFAPKENTMSQAKDQITKAQATFSGKRAASVDAKAEPKLKAKVETDVNAKVETDVNAKVETDVNAKGAELTKAKSPASETAALQTNTDANKPQAAKAKHTNHTPKASTQKPTQALAEEGVDVKETKKTKQAIAPTANHKTTKQAKVQMTDEPKVEPQSVLNPQASDAVVAKSVLETNAKPALQGRESVAVSATGADKAQAPIKNARIDRLDDKQVSPEFAADEALEEAGVQRLAGKNIKPVEQQVDRLVKRAEKQLNPITSANAKVENVKATEAPAAAKISAVDVAQAQKAPKQSTIAQLQKEALEKRHLVKQQQKESSLIAAKGDLKSEGLMNEAETAQLEPEFTDRSAGFMQTVAQQQTSTVKQTVQRTLQTAEFKVDEAKAALSKATEASTMINPTNTINPSANAYTAAAMAANAPAGSSNQIYAQPGKPGWNQAISQKVMYMVGTGDQTARLNLNPPELGPLQVVIQMNNEKADTTFISESEEVRQALEDGMDFLKDKMDEAGLSLGQANVNDGQQFEQQNARQSFAGSQQNGRNNQQNQTGEAVPTLSQEIVSSNNGLVDTFA